MDLVKRFGVYLVNLDPVVNGKPRTSRPCVVVSPDEMNRYLKTVIVVPLTSRKQDLPTRVPIHFKLKPGQIALEQIRVLDKSRLIKSLGKLGDNTRDEVVRILGEMFSGG
jgi:mRNA interferase MazF